MLPASGFSFHTSQTATTHCFAQPLSLGIFFPPLLLLLARRYYLFIAASNHRKRSPDRLICSFPSLHAQYSPQHPTPDTQPAAANRNFVGEGPLPELLKFTIYAPYRLYFPGSSQSPSPSPFYRLNPTV